MPAAYRYRGPVLPEGVAQALSLLAQCPTRYRDLHTALPAISTAVLTDRLRMLTYAGPVCRRLVNGEPGVHYEAIDAGATLARPLANLAATAATLRKAAP